jgi:hypothetical protein
MPSAVEEIRIKVATRLHEVEAEIDSLRSALEALDTEAEAAAAAHAEAEAAAARAEAAPEPSAGAKRRAGTPRSRRGSGAARRGRAGAADPAPVKDARAAARLEELERVLAETGGPEAVALARATGIDPAEVLARITELERAGRGRE